MCKNVYYITKLNNGNIHEITTDNLDTFPQSIYKGCPINFQIKIFHPSQIHSSFRTETKKRGEEK